MSLDVWISRNGEDFVAVRRGSNEPQLIGLNFSGGQDPQDGSFLLCYRWWRLAGGPPVKKGCKRLLKNVKISFDETDE